MVHLLLISKFFDFYLELILEEFKDVESSIFVCPISFSLSLK